MKRSPKILAEVLVYNSVFTTCSITKFSGAMYTSVYTYLLF